MQQQWLMLPVFQIYYYHNVKCRVEMFDKDLAMLQVRWFWLVLLGSALVLFWFWLGLVTAAVSPGRRLHDGSESLPDDRSEPLRTLPHLQRRRPAEEIQGGQQGQNWVRYGHIIL